MLQIITDKVLTLIKYDPLQPLMFNSGFFLYFFVFVILFYNFVKSNIKVRNIYLMLVSFFFYYKSSGLFLGILIFSTVLDFTIARYMYQSNSQRIKRLWLLFSLVTNIGLLCYFKYTNFFFSSFSHFFGYEFTPFDILLPVGISFYTFQSISYIIDIYKMEIKPLSSYLDYAFYVSFFPQLVAGPIVRAKDFIPQISKTNYVNQIMLGRGTFLIMAGLFKKVIISDYLSVNFVDRIFDAPSLYSGFENLLGCYGYALQIYCDFSGYSDMAIGIALLLGFKFNDNFNLPYQSSSITEFWKRWHISLSSWLKDYLYIPLGGNKKGIFRTYFNLLLTMIIGGFWHGASVSFIIWGLWHGVLLAFDKLRLSLFPVGNKNGMKRKMIKVLGIFITFHLVCIGWVLFRSDTLNTAISIFSQIKNGIDFSLFPQFAKGYTSVFFLIVLGYSLHFVPKKVDHMLILYFSRKGSFYLALIMALFLFLLIQVRSSDIQPFIYFQF